MRIAVVKTVVGTLVSRQDCRERVRRWGKCSSCSFSVVRDLKGRLRRLLACLQPSGRGFDPLCAHDICAGQGASGSIEGAILVQ